MSNSQNQFMIQEDGLTPTTITSEIKELKQNVLFEKTLNWIDKNAESNNLVVEDSTLHKSIRISFIKGNAITLEKQYFNAKYEVLINFDNGSYSFEPTKIQLKLNSKYDMGWKDFNLRNGMEFYKKGRPKRKYKSYLKNLVAPLNKVHQDIDTYLQQD